MRPLQWWRWGHWTIAARLTLLYMAAAGLTLFCAGGVLYLWLSQGLYQDERAALLTKMFELEQIVTEGGINSELLRHEVMFTGSPSVNRLEFARVVGKDGAAVLESPGINGMLPVDIFPVPVGGSGPPVAVHQNPGGRIFLVASRKIASSSQNPVLQTAIDVTEERQLLAGVLHRLEALTAMATVLSALIGYLVARQGLHPLRRMVERAKGITIERLSDRLGSAPWPAELQRLALALDGMLDRIEAAFERVTGFSADLAHELRTPINNLMGQIEVNLLKDHDTQTYKELLESALEELQRVTRTLESLLFLARVDQGVTLREEWLDVRVELERVRAYHEVLAEEHGIAIEVNGYGDVLADPDLMRGALSNVLSNSLRHTPRGGHVKMCAVHTGDESRIIISDTGSGIEPEDLPRVLDRFYRGRIESSTPGTGLGLPIAQAVMRAHGGGIRLESEPRKGTCVQLWFPANRGRFSRG